MRSDQQAERQRHSRADLTGKASRGPAAWRRWALLVTGAVSVAIAMGYAIALRSTFDPEGPRLEKSIANLASEASPDAALLLHQAGEVADSLLREFPYSGDALDVVAQLYQGLGRTDDAVRCWERCIELDPELGSSLHAAIGSAAFEEGEFDVAAEHYRMAMNLDPGSSTHPVHLAEALIDRGKLEEAVEVLEGNLKTSPKSMPTNVLLGRAHLQLRQYEKARQHLEIGVQMGPEYTNAYYSLARACAALGDQEKSKEYLAKFKELQAQEEQLHRDFLKATGETDEISQLVVRTYTAAAQVYIAHGDYHTGEVHLVKAAELSANETDCRVVLAWLYEQQGRTDKALQELAGVSERASDNLSAQLSIASAYTRLQRFDEAENAYRKAIELTPHQAGGYAALTKLYIQAGRKSSEARILAQKAVELEPAAEYYFLLSLSCQSNGDLAGACCAAEQAMAADPNNEEYQRLNQRLQRLIRTSAPNETDYPQGASTTSLKTY